MPNEYEPPIGDKPAISGAVIPPAPRHDPYAAFRSRGYRFFTTGNLLSIIGRQMLAVAVEWEIYRRTHSATALGLVGLVFAVPIVGFSLPAGHLADRLSRKHIILVAQIFSAITSALLAFVSWQHLNIPQLSILQTCNRGLSAIAGVFEQHQQTFHFDDASIPLIYLLLFVGAIARTFSWAARSSFFPTLVPRDAFSNAVTWNSSVFQIGSVVGPALSGFVVARQGFPIVYAIDAITSTLFFFLVLPIPRAKKAAERKEESTWKSLAAGAKFVFSKKVILATITLDLFAVLLGGSVALLPIFADQILHCGPVGPRVDAGRAGDRCICDGAIGRVLATYASGRPDPAVVRRRIWNCDNRLRIIESILAFAAHAFHCRRCRQRKRDHPRLDCAVSNTGSHARPSFVGEQYFHWDFERVWRT